MKKRTRNILIISIVCFLLVIGVSLSGALSGLGLGIRDALGGVVLSPESSDTVVDPSLSDDEPKEYDVNDVNFYDYDGDLLYSYSTEQAVSLSAMPELPDRSSEGLLCEGWNWELSDLKEYVGKYGICDVGAVYNTVDGSTRLQLVFVDDVNLAAELRFNQSKADGVKISWGDGTSVETSAILGDNVLTHTYDKPGTYTVTLLPDEDCQVILGSLDETTGFGFLGGTDDASKVKLARIQSLNVGRNVQIGDRAFQHCGALTKVTLSSGVKQFGYCAFNFCYSLQNIVLPNNIEYLDNGVFASCFGLKTVCMPRNIGELIEDSHFSSCYSLRRLVIPDSLTTLPSGFSSRNYAISFYVIPDSVTSIVGGGFYFNTGCKVFDFTNSKDVVSITTRDCFNGKTSDARAKVPPELFNKWIYSDVWKDWNWWFVEAEGVELFRIGNSWYGYIVGRTWSEWEFADDLHYKIVDGYVYGVNGEAVKDINGNHVKSTDLMTSEQYSLVSGG